MRIRHSPRVYKLFLIAGFIAIGALTALSLVLFDPQGRTLLPLYVGIGASMLYLLSIILYWWLQFLFGDYLEGLNKGSEGPPEQCAKEMKKTRQRVLKFFALATYLALAFMAGALIYLFTGEKWMIGIALASIPIVLTLGFAAALR
ncbi:MAG: hypothetical protein U1F66_07335 [bacterium]